LQTVGDIELVDVDRTVPERAVFLVVALVDVADKLPEGEPVAAAVILVYIFVIGTRPADGVNVTVVP
jgi:hypothetical protein